jgi:hypothetical protein
MNNQNTDPSAVIKELYHYFKIDSYYPLGFECVSHVDVLEAWWLVWEC